MNNKNSLNLVENLKKPMNFLRLNYSTIQSILLISILYTSFLRGTNILKSNMKILIAATIIVGILTLLVAIMRFIKDGFKISFDESLILFFFISLTFYAFINNSKSYKEYFQPITFFGTYFAVSTALKTFNWNSKTTIFTLKLFISIPVMFFISTIYPLVMNKPDWIFSTLSYNTNDLGNQMLLGVMGTTTLALFHVSKKNYAPKTFLLLLSIPIGIVMIMVVSSRGALFGLFCYLLITFIFVIKHKIISLQILKKYKKVTFSFIAFFLITFAFLIYSNVLINFLMKFQHGTSNRTDLWLGFLNDYIGNFPSRKFFTGEGYASFRQTVASYVRNEAAYSVPHLHNFILESWGRYGFINLSILLFITFKFIKNSFKSKHLWFFALIPFGYMGRDMFEANLFITAFRWEMLFFWFALLLPSYYKESTDEEITK